MELAENIWSNDWPSRTMQRVRERGAESLLELLSSRPSVPYITLAKELGSDVAAIQVVRLQFAEAGERHSIRSAVMDAAARLCHQHLKRGWGKGMHADFNTSGVFADLVSFLEMRDNASELVAKWKAVWESLKSAPPAEGWLPTGPDDPILVAAFEKGWPAPTKRKIKRQDYGLLCPNCTAVLSLPNPHTKEIVCRLCGEQIELV